MGNKKATKSKTDNNKNRINDLDTTSPKNLHSFLSDARLKKIFASTQSKFQQATWGLNRFRMKRHSLVGRIHISHPWKKGTFESMIFSYFAFGGIYHCSLGGNKHWSLFWKTFSYTYSLLGELWVKEKGAWYTFHHTIRYLSAISFGSHSNDRISFVQVRWMCAIPSLLDEFWLLMVLSRWGVNSSLSCCFFLTYEVGEQLCKLNKLCWCSLWIQYVTYVSHATCLEICRIIELERCTLPETNVAPENRLPQ